MPIKLTCPNCQRTLMVPKSDAGKAAMCNACGQRLQIPGLPPTLSQMKQAFDPLLPPAPADVPHSIPQPSVPPPAPATAPLLPPLPQPARTPVPSAAQRLEDAAADTDALASSPSVLLRPPATSGGGAGTLVAVVVILLVGLGVWRYYAKKPDAWEMANQSTIRKMIDDADTTVIKGNLAAAAQKYKEVESFVGDRTVVDPSLHELLNRASDQKHRILSQLVVKNTVPVPAVPAPQPVTTASNDVDPPTTPASTKPAAPVAVVAPQAPSQPEPLIDLKITRQTPKLEPVNDERIGTSIQKGADWLIQRFDPKTHQLRGDPDRAAYRGGLNALCIYALLQAGMAIHDDRLDVHKDFMKGLLSTLDTLTMGERQTYGRGLRTSALALYNRKEDRKALQLDITWLLKSHKGGAYGYNEMRSPDDWDNSNAQYGLLGVWSGAEVDVEVPGAYWRSVQAHWEKCQTESGGWGYQTNAATLSMSCAGVASLFVCHDYLDAAVPAGVNVGRPPFSPHLEKGLAWLEDGDHVLDNGMMWGYTLYGVERVGLASGLKFFGKHDWFRERAFQAFELQQPNGSWADEEKETAYALLFLARGRHPILMNKLRFDGFWSNRPRDVANLARFASKELERPLNFQVVNVDREWTDWTDSRVLYLASHVAPALTETQINNLRQFVQAGGLLYMQADGGAPAFDQFAQDLSKQLFPQYPMMAVPKEHPIYSMLYKIDPAPPLKMVSNGVRALVVYSPQDLSIAWQQRMEKSRPAAFQLGVNLFLYAAGKTDLKNRVASNVIPEPKPATGGKIPVARLSYAGAWDPEPGAWARFARWFQQETSCAVDVKPIDLAALKLKTAPFAHLTGSAAFTPAPEQVAAVRAYVDGGGTLFIDAAGGSVPFATSAVQLLAKAFPDASLKKLPTTHPILTATFPGMVALTDPPELRVYALTLLGKGAGVLEGLSHGKGRVISTSLDVTSGLLATNTWGIAGYTSEYAQALLKNALIWTAGGAPDKPKP